MGEKTLLATASDQDRDAILRRSFTDFADHRALLGNREFAAARLRDFAAMGVDEVAALVDFGLAENDVLASLERLAEVRRAVTGS